MMRNSFLVSMLGSLAILLIGVDVVQAQRVPLRERRIERREMRRGVETRAVTTEPMVGAVTGAVVVPGSTTSRLSYYPAVEGIPNAAQIRVILPDAQARVMFDGAPTTQMGTVRLYHTPSLTVGAANQYRVQAVLMQNGREVTLERTVSVAPGMTYVLDFTRR